MNPEDDAFSKGYSDSKLSLSSASATSLSTSHYYAPPDDFKGPYDSGWRKAEDEMAATMSRRERRGDVLVPLTLGFLLVGAGFGITVFTFRAGGLFVYAYGAIFAGIGFITRGIMALRRGTDAPSQ